MTIIKPAVEQTIFAWLESLCSSAKRGLGIAAGETVAERIMGLSL